MIRKRKFLFLTLVVLATLSLTPIIILTRTYGIVHPDMRPQPMPTTPILEAQTESFTCGVHALSTVYKAYGLDPEQERIRWRLGADTKAVVWLEDSTGVMHPDLYMVLAQDYFAVIDLDLHAESAWQDLLSHLDSGHMAILLINRRENGAMHWVVATNHSENEITIYDSLFSLPYKENKQFLEDYALSVLMIKPLDQTDDGISSIQAHKLGTKELGAAVKRGQTRK